MTYEKFYGVCEYFHGWRCIACGEIVDQTILEKRNDFMESRIVETTGRWERQKIRKGNPGNINKGSIKKFNPEKYGWWSVQIVTAPGMFRIHSVNAAPNVGALDISRKKRKRKKTA